MFYHILEIIHTVFLLSGVAYLANVAGRICSGQAKTLYKEDMKLATRAGIRAHKAKHNLISFK